MKNTFVKKNALLGLFLAVGAVILPMAARASFPWHWHFAFRVRPADIEERKAQLRTEMFQKRQELIQKFESRTEKLKEKLHKGSEEARQLWEGERQTILSRGSTTPESTTTPYDFTTFSKTLRDDIKKFFSHNGFVHDIRKIFNDS